MGELVKRLLLLLTSIVIVSCATSEGYREAMETWIDGSADKLIDQWGYPIDIFDKPRSPGIEVYVYYNLRHEYLSNGARLDFWCRTYFEVDRKTGAIVHARWEGNDCKHLPSWAW